MALALLPLLALANTWADESTSQRGMPGITRFSAARRKFRNMDAHLQGDGLCEEERHEGDEDVLQVRVIGAQT